MSKKDNHITLSEALKLFIDKNNLQSGIDRIQVKEVWTAAMGKGVNSYTTAVTLNRETLTVALSSSVLREELSYRKEEIIVMLNKALGKNLIKTLRLR